MTTDNKSIDILTPSILIQRVKICFGNKSVYDEKFHEGLNIIAGENDVGKTSLIQLIVYGLGSAIHQDEWTNEARQCDVYLELKLNSEVITLKRERFSLTNSYQNPIFICFSELDIAKKATQENWLRYPYAKSSDRESFSTKILSLLQMPIYQTDEESKNLNLNQFFRLLYSEQTKKTGDLFNVYGHWESGSTRQAIGDYLLGVYDDTVAEIEREISTKTKELDKYVTDIRGFYNVANKFTDELVLEDIGQTYTNWAEHQKLNIKNKIEEANAKIAVKRERLLSLDSKEECKTLENNNRNLAKIKQELFEISQKISFLEYDILDSKNFIRELELNLNALNDSIAINEKLPEIKFHSCPSCFQQIKEEDHIEGLCDLCGSITNEKPLNLLRMQHEVSMQLEESKNINARRENKLKECRDNKRILVRKQAILINKLNAITTSYNTTIEEEIYDLYNLIGSFEGEIKEIESLEDAYNYIQEIIIKRDDLQKDINHLNDRLEQESSKNTYKKRKKETEDVIVRNITSILNKDYKYNDDFHNVDSLSFSFSDNRIILNDKKLSASGTSYLMHAFTISLLLASLELSYMRVPRLVIIDGLDSDGIDEARLKNYQQTIFSMMSEFPSVQKQMILVPGEFVSNGLEDKIVGRFYKKGDYILDMEKL